MNPSSERRKILDDAVTFQVEHVVDVRRSDVQEHDVNSSSEVGTLRKSLVNHILYPLLVWYVPYRIYRTISRT